MTFAQDLFSGSSCFRWTVAAIAFVSAVVFPVMNSDLSGIRFLIGIFLEILLLLLLVAMIAPRRCAFAGRVLAGLVFLAYVGYGVDMLIEKPDSFWPPSSRQSSATGFNAVCGLFIIGVPALVYALRGEFLPRVDKSPSEAVDEAADENEADADLVTTENRH